MFKRISIELTEPICTCKQQSLGWSVDSQPEGSGLCITCKECKTSLKIPYTKLLGQFAFDKPYPEGIKPKNEEEAKKEAELNAAKLKKQEEEAAAKKKQDEEKSLRLLSDLERNAKKNIN